MKKIIVNLKVEDLFPPLARDAEVLPVVMFPNKKILLHTKDIYPKGTYRLLTGGIKKNEDTQKALIRELKEETDIKILDKRLLAKLIYKIKHPEGKKIYTTYIFLVKSKSSTIKNRGSKEHISGFKIIRISQLPLVIRKLRSLRSGPKVRFYHVENWKEWGEFRAIAHQVVYDLLKNYH